MERHYQNSKSDSAMTEIALALAMGFFSIMVLTMVSMGATGNPTSNDGVASAVTAALQAPANDTSSHALPKGQAEDRLLIFYKGRFFDQDLNSASIERLDGSSRIILAFPPDLPMSDALSARALINHDNLIISTLNDEWMTTLKEAVQ